MATIGKRRTRQHVIADMSVNHVERFVVRTGHTVQRIVFDYGYDLFLQTFDEDGVVERGYALLQLKATDALVTVDDGKFVSVSIDRRICSRGLKTVRPCF